MSLRNTSLSLGLILLTAVAAGAQTISVNGETPPNAVTVGAATGVAIAVADGPGNTTDWIALYPVGAPNNRYLSWSYLSGTGTPPASGLASTTFNTYAPLTPGDYEWRLFAHNSSTRIATSALVTVTASTAQRERTSPGARRSSILDATNLGLLLLRGCDHENTIAR